MSRPSATIRTQPYGALGGHPLLNQSPSLGPNPWGSRLRSCRGTTIGQLYNKKLIEERSDVSTLFLESDMCDVNSFSEGVWKTKLDGFFESLEARKKAGS